MSKAVLVINTSSTCKECELHCITFGCKKLMKRYENYKDGKPDWCTLKPMPEKKETNVLSTSPLLKGTLSEYSKGWNDCIDAIMGGKTDD